MQLSRELTWILDQIGMKPTIFGVIWAVAVSVRAELVPVTATHLAVRIRGSAAFLRHPPPSSRSAAWEGQPHFLSIVQPRNPRTEAISWWPDILGFCRAFFTVRMKALKEGVVLASRLLCTGSGWEGQGERLISSILFNFSNCFFIFQLFQR